MKCCGCIPIKVGASLIAFFGILICAMELTLLVPYLIEPKGCNYDITKFNSDQDSDCKHALQLTGAGLKIFGEWLRKELTIPDTDEDYKLTMKCIWWTCLALTIEATIYAFSCLLVMTGVCCNGKHILMFLICDIIRMIMLFVLGIGITIGFFFIGTKWGVGMGALILWFLFLYSLFAVYSWKLVQRAYLYYDIYKVQVVDDQEMESFVDLRALTTYTTDFPLHE